MSKILEEINKRNKLIIENKPQNVNYFDIQNYLNLELYSTYIFITPRNIGKTYSGYKLVKEVYETTGEYTIWMRSAEVELKEIIRDFAETKYDFWPETWKLRGNSVIDTENDKLVLKFIALSTAHNFASIKGNGCFGIIYDEFLPRSSRTQPSFKALTDFIKTVERDKLLTVILMANATTLNSEILNSFDIWTDNDEYSSYDKRLFYRRFTKWENGPQVEGLSTSYIWASTNQDILDYMYNSKFQDSNDYTVIPLSRLNVSEWIKVYKLNGEIFSVGVDNGKFVLSPGNYDNDSYIFNLTPTDTFSPDPDTVNIVDVKTELHFLFYAMTIANVIFTSYELRDKFYDFTLKYIPRKL